MASGYTSRWRRVLYRWIPRLFSECPAGNQHWRWDLICTCCIDENSQGMYYREHNIDSWHECPAYAHNVTHDNQTRYER